MLLYIGVATFLFLGYFYKKDRLWYIFSLLLLFCFSAFRDLSLGGWDAKYYSDYYYSVPPLTAYNGFQSKYEIGYTLFNSFLKIFSGSYAFFQIVYTAVTLFLLHIVINKLEFNDSEKCLFLFVYFCYRYIWNTWVLLRQNFANLIVWMLIFSVFSLKGKKWIGVFIAIIISALFHSTAIFNLILFPFMLLIKKVNPKIILIFTTILSIILYFFGSTYMEKIFEIVTRFAGDRFEKYANDDAGINAVNLLLRLSVMWLIGLNIERINYKYIKEVFVAIAISVVLGSINVSIVVRFYEYYAIGVYVGIVTLIKIFRKKDSAMIAIGIYLLMVIILIRYLQVGFYDGAYRLLF